MKDPLQDKETPYEILNVETTADKKTIDAAFKKAMVGGGNVAKVRDAWNTLSRPVDRGFVDLFLYNDAFNNQMVPRVKENALQLLSGRAETAQAWSTIQKKLFPNYAATHSLALLWYWWALYSEEAQWAEITGAPFNQREGLSSADSPSLLWRNAISNWVFIINSDDFWNEWARSKDGAATYLAGKDDALALRKKTEDHFTNVLHSYSERYRGRSDSGGVKKFQEYEMILSTEIKTARQLSSEGLRLSVGGKQFTVCCGKMMLEQVGMLEPLRRQLEAAIERNPTDQKLADLASALSPFSNIAVMIERKKYDEAIKSIRALPADQKQSEEVKELKAKAHFEKGKQEFSLGNFESATINWAAAAKPGRMRDEIRQTVASLCQSKAAALQNSDPDTAIKILEDAIIIAGSNSNNSANLKLTLAEVLTHRGIGRLNDAQRRMETEKRGATRDVLNLMERGLTDLKQGAKLGSKRAAENAEVAERVLEQAKSGMLDMSKAALDLIQQANEAADRGKLDDAARLMRQAVEQSKGNAQEALKKQLAVLLNAKAIDAVNRLMPTLNSAGEENEQLVQMKIEAFLSGKKYSKSKGGSKKSFKQYLPLLVVCTAAAGVAIYFWGPQIWSSLEVALPVLLGILFFGNLLVQAGMWLSQNVKLPTYNAYGSYGHQQSPPCKLCSSSAYYQYNLGGGVVSLCGTHADELRQIAEGPVEVNGLSMSILIDAVAELAEASRLDPSSSQIRQNYEDVQKMAARFKPSDFDDIFNKYFKANA